MSVVAQKNYQYTNMNDEWKLNGVRLLNCPLTFRANTQHAKGHRGDFVRRRPSGLLLVG